MRVIGGVPLGFAFQSQARLAEPAIGSFPREKAAVGRAGERT